MRRLEPFEAAVRDLETRLQETEQSRSVRDGSNGGEQTGGSRGQRWERFIEYVMFYLLKWMSFI